MYFLISASLIWTIIASALVPVLTEDTKTYRFPYSLFLSGIGSIFTVVLAFIYLVRLIKVMSALSPSYQPLKWAILISRKYEDSEKWSSSGVHGLCSAEREGGIYSVRICYVMFNRRINPPVIAFNVSFGDL